VEKLEAKFAVVSTKSKSMYDEEEPKSQAYYVIKAAQQRQELQVKGDQLDAENHRLQKEVCGEYNFAGVWKCTPECSWYFFDMLVHYTGIKGSPIDVMHHGIFWSHRLQPSSEHWSRWLRAIMLITNRTNQ
jgi:hypothetical protein